MPCHAGQTLSQDRVALPDGLPRGGQDAERHGAAKQQHPHLLGRGAALLLRRLPGRSAVHPGELALAGSGCMSILPWSVCLSVLHVLQVCVQSQHLRQTTPNLIASRWTGAAAARAGAARMQRAGAAVLAMLGPGLCCDMAVDHGGAVLGLCHAKGAACVATHDARYLMERMVRAPKHVQG